jgi:hypothetical protein
MDDSTKKTTDPFLTSSGTPSTVTTAASAAPPTQKIFPTLPPFTPDPSKPTGASTWLERVEIKLTFCNGITDEEKIRWVCCSLDEDSFERIQRALLPAKITTYADWDGFKTTFIGLYDTQRSLFADRYAALKIQWDGPAQEPIREFVARVRQAVTLFKCAEFGDNELSTMLLLTAMKAPALESLRSLLLNALIKNPKADLGDVTTLLDNALMTERDQKLPEERQLNVVKKLQPNHQRKAVRKPQHTSPSQASSSKPPPSPCFGCGGPHWNRDCPYKESKCNECGIKGHLAKMCPKKGNAPRGGRVQSSNTVSGKKHFKKYVGTVHVLHLNTTSSVVNRQYLDVSINGTTIKLQWDTGADMTILTPRDYRCCGSPKLQTSSVKACTANKERIKFKGYFNAMVKCKNVSKQMAIHVAEIPGSLLGLDFCDTMEVQFTPNATATVATVSTPTSTVSASSKTTSSSIKDDSVQVSTATSTRNDVSSKATTPGSRISSSSKPLVYCKAAVPISSHTPKVQHQPTTSNGSTASIKAVDETSATQSMVNSISRLPVSSKDIVESYKADPYAQDILAQLQSGKPRDTNINRFSLISDVIHMQDRVYIPTVLRSAILEQLHVGHNGISRTKALARQHCFWPGISKDIEKMIAGCYECIQASNTPIKATLASWPMSLRPGQRVHLDFAGPLHGYMVLIIFDSYSKWIDAQPMKNATAYATLKVLLRYAADNGMPQLLVSDNGTQFTSKQFQRFCKENGIKHRTSPVYHPQSNGQAEKMVQVYKNFIKKKALESGNNPFDIHLATSQFLCCYRTTPNTATPGNCTPAKAHLGRELRTILDQIRPEVVDILSENVSQNDSFNRQHGARKRKFLVKDTVFYRLKNGTSWIAATVAARLGKRLYLLSNTANGKDIRVHANQIKNRIVALPSNSSLKFLKSPNDFDYAQDSMDDYHSMIQGPSSRASESSCSFHTAEELSSDDSTVTQPVPQSPPARRRGQRTRTQTQRLNIGKLNTKSYC